MDRKYLEEDLLWGLSSDPMPEDGLLADDGVTYLTNDAGDYLIQG